MADFGKAGKLTIRTHDVAVIINLTNKEYIHYKLSVQGADPIFTFACMHGARLSEHQFSGHPKQTYEWTWARSAALPNVPNESNDASDDMYGVAMSFLAAIKYTLVVEHRDQSDKKIRTLKDIDYESKDPHDNFTESLRVFTT